MQRRIWLKELSDKIKKKGIIWYEALYLLSCHIYTSLNNQLSPTLQEISHEFYNKYQF